MIEIQPISKSESYLMRKLTNENVSEKHSRSTMSRSSPSTPTTMLSQTLISSTGRLSVLPKEEAEEEQRSLGEKDKHRHRNRDSNRRLAEAEVTSIVTTAAAVTTKGIGDRNYQPQ